MRLQAAKFPLGRKDQLSALKVMRLTTGDAPSEWTLYRAKDQRTGLTTIKARPDRVRDPMGGYHTWIRPDGSRARLPNMTNLSRFDGKSGPHVGPRKLFKPLERAAYQPILQRPWDECGDEAMALLPGLLSNELDHRIERMRQGRSF